MRNFFAHLLSKTCRNQTNETWRSQLTFGFEKGRCSGRTNRPRTRQNRIEPLSKQLRAVYEPTTRDNALPAWSNFLRFAATKSFLRYAAMVTLLLTLACGNVWGTSATVGITTTSSGTSGGAGTARTVSGATNLTVTHQLVSTTSGAIAEYSSGDKEAYYHSNSKLYTKGAYKWNKNTSATEIVTANNTVGYQVVVGSGYKYSLSSLTFQIAASCNMTYKIAIVNATETLYSSSEYTMTSYNSGSSTNYQQTIDLSGVSKVQNLTGTFVVKVYLKFNSTGKYLFFPTFTVTGDVAAAASDAYAIHIGKNNADYTDESLTNTSGTTWSKTISLDASSYYEFKVKKTPSAGDDVWYGNNGKITATTSPAWDFSTSDGNCKLYTTVAGSYTFSWDTSNNKLTVSYPAGTHSTKRIYMACGSTWCDASPKFFVHSWGVTDYNTEVQQNACGDYYADIIWYNDYFQFTRNPSTATAYNDNTWNYSQDLTYDSDKLLWTCTGWSGSNGTFSSSVYTPTTYTISYAKGSVPSGGGSISGSKANETKTCGVDFTLPSSAVFTTTGYTQTGWTTSDGSSQTHTLGGSYTENAAQAFYPVWTVNSHTLTWDFAGGSSNLTEGTNYTAHGSVNYGTTLVYPTNASMSKTGYNFSAWSSTPSTMPDNDLTITAQWTAKTTTITIDANTANHGSTTPGTVTATYGSALPSFTAASGVGDWSLTGYWTAATGGNKIINADGTLVASTSYADGSSLWNSEAATLTLYAQYEEECTPQTISKVVLTAVDAGTVSGYNENEYAGAAVIGGLKSTNTAEVDASHAGVETGYKLNDNGKGIVFATLAKGTFQVGDVIKVTITYPNDNHTFAAPVSSKEALELFYGTNKDDATSLTILTGVSAAGTYSYTLTAADVTAIGSKKGIGVFRHSDRKQNPFVYSVEIYGCRDWVIEEEGLVNWTMNLNTNTWGTSSTSTTDETNISSISTSANTTDGTREGTTKKINLASAADNVNNAASFTFSLNSAKKIEPEKVTCKVFNVGDDEGLNYKAQLSDDNGHVYYSTNTVIPNTEATLTDAVFNFASDLILTGDITVKVYCWKSSGSGSAFRMGPKIRFFGEVQSAADYTVTHTLSNVTKSAGETSVKEGNNYTATFAASSGYTLPAAITVTVGGATKTAGTDYTWNQETGVVTIPGNVVTGNIVITVTGAAIVHHDVTFSLTNVVYSSGDNQGTDAATEGSAFSTVFAANSGYDLPSTITVTIGGAAATAGTDYTWNSSTGAFEVPAAKVTGDIVVTIVGPEHVESSCVTITNFATSNTTNATGDGQSKMFYGYKGSVSDANAITITSNDGNDRGQNSGVEMRLTYGKKMRIYADNTNDGAPATFSNVVSVSFKWKFIASGNSGNTELTSSYTVKVGSTIIANAVSITGKTNDGYATVTIGNLAQLNGYIEFLFGGSSSSYNVYLDDIEICTADMEACTTPVVPSLTNQSLCSGANAAAWDATQTAVLAEGESVAYQWQKKNGSNWDDISGATTATYDVDGSGTVTEAMAGTYRVVVTVSKAGKSSTTANKEVTLSVTESTEVTGITADKATVYPGNSVTLTATANTTVTWQWYTCTNAEGAGEASIGEATSASYTIASAPAAGTYYYKAKGTSSCGTAEYVYSLTVSAAAECETYYWFIYADDATNNGVVNNRDGFFSNTSTGSGNTGTYTMTVDGVAMTGTKRLSTGAYKPKFTVPAGATATLYIYGKAASADAGKHLVLKRTSDDAEVEVTSNTTVQAYTKENIEAGEWTLSCGSSNWCYSFFAVKVCSASSCTDATPTATAAATTVCSGSELSITASGYETDPTTIQWQKLNSSTSTWDNISGATEATYTVASATASNAGSYRVVVTKGCARTSNTVTIAVPSAPVFGTVPSSVSVMQTQALSITTVEATDAVKYRWYKSADATWDAGDAEIGTDKNLIKAYADEATGSPSYYVFCRAQNSCGITTSNAIAVNVTAYIEEDCATRGNEGEAEFEFDYGSAGQGSYSSTACWTMNSNSKVLTYTAPTGKYFKTAKVTIASSNASKASYNWSTNGGSTYTSVALTVNSTLTERTINLAAHGNVDKFQIGRNFDGKGESGGTLYVSKICFEYSESCTSTTVTPNTSSVNYEMGGAWSNPTFTLTPAAVSGGTLTYSSSNEDIATVDDDGTVTFQGEAGSVTITASYAGGTVSSTDYCASSGSYTIAVSCPGGAPKVVVDGSTNMSGCNSSITLHAKQSDGTSDFVGGSYQWFRNGEEISGATSKDYTALQAGTYTVEYTTSGGCTSPSSNSATVTSETTEPEVERLVPFQYYHVNKTYTAQMKMRHLFAVKNSGKLDGKSFKLYVSRNGGAATDVTSSNALEIWSNADGRVDTVMIDLNKLSGKYSEDDELVYTCKAIDCSSNVSETYKATITMHVIGSTPTLALICSGAKKDGTGTRKTGNMVVGGDFLTGWNPADLCQQTGNDDKSFNEGVEWGLYTELKSEYIVTPVNGYANFYKLNYEPFDILFLTDYPKASKSDAAATILDDMAELVDFRPLFSFKTHMVHKNPSKWAAKGFTTEPVVPKKTDGRLNLNIVCYAHPMFQGIMTGADVYRDNSDASQLVYTMLTREGYEKSKGMQGFEIEAAENFVTIGLIHDTAFIAFNEPTVGKATWTTNPKDRMLVTVAERQANLEARMILFSLNAGAHSKLTDKGEQVVLKCLEYLISDATDPLTPVADCSLTFDNADGDNMWSNPANWGPTYLNIPGEFNSARIAAPVTVDIEDARAMELRIVEGGRITIPAGKALEVTSTVRRMEGHVISPTEVSDIVIGSGSTGNGTLIFNNKSGDSKANVHMYSKAQNLEDGEHCTWQYVGMPFQPITDARSNYYNAWLYSWNPTNGWEVVHNGGPVYPWKGYCITHPTLGVVYDMTGTLTETGTIEIEVPANSFQVIGNSWTAPIQIANFADADFGELTRSVYFFNTGTDSTGTGSVTVSATGDARWAPGTYVSVPIHSSPYTGDSVINSMQGFYVVNTSGSATTLSLDYDKVVRPKSGQSLVQGPMHAPRRYAATNELSVLKIMASGSRYDDKLVVLEREDFTTGTDDGWDGEKWDGSTISPCIWSVNSEGGVEAVTATPSMDGTIIGFRAGEDSEYTFSFDYNGEEDLYLLDVDTKIYTPIVTGGAYHFTCADKGEYNRFILTRKAPQIATGVEDVQGNEGARAKKLLIENKMYILLNGMLYDATGKVVK